ncbi:hypothetical protein L208DRAFT_512858 [Tricholoma matsutake]|nr:hypothetical protein L208DRAFT_512858 [Tricholoma matsutake 945]
MNSLIEYNNYIYQRTKNTKSPPLIVIPPLSFPSPLRHFPSSFPPPLFVVVPPFLSLGCLVGLIIIPPTVHPMSSCS